MGRMRILLPMFLGSLAFFAAAAFIAEDDNQAFLFLIAGAFLPLIGIVIITLSAMAKWKAMGKELGLLAGPGAYPDLLGRYQGKRLKILRRSNPYGTAPRVMTVIRLEGYPEVQLPGLVASAAAVRQVLAPLTGDLDEDADAARILADLPDGLE